MKSKVLLIIIGRKTMKKKMRKFDRIAHATNSALPDSPHQAGYRTSCEGGRAPCHPVGQRAAALRA
jgi:hypothetical protein